MRTTRALAGFDEFTRHVNPTFGRFLSMTGRDLRLIAARDTSLIDVDGRIFDDWISGFGIFNLGHNPEVVRRAMRDALDEDAPNLFTENVNPPAGALAAMLTATAGPPFEVATFCNSGSEAVECAIKTAMLATGRTRIAYADRAYHGVTLGALACTGRGPFRDPFEGVLHDFIEVSFGDLEALERVAGDIAAFIVEPVQMEGGARVATTEYLRRASEVCARRGALLILDEVQTGMGRTGRLFAYQMLDVRPDIFVLAKALGGGLMPIGAIVTTRDIWARAWGPYLRCEAQNHSFAGNTLACRAAQATLAAIDQPSFLATVRNRAEELFAALRARIGTSPFVKRISHLGLMGGIELLEPDHPWLGWNAIGLPELSGLPVSGPLVVDRLQRNGILAQVCAHDWSVVRIEPPLIVSRATCARFVDAIGEAIDWLEATA